MWCRRRCVPHPPGPGPSNPRGRRRPPSASCCGRRRRRRRPIPPCRSQHFACAGTIRGVFVHSGCPAKIELLHLRVVEKLIPSPLELDGPQLEDAPPLCRGQSHPSILLDEEDRGTELVEHPHLLHHEPSRARLEPEGWLIQ